MSVAPLLGDGGALGLAVFSVVFFGAVFLLSYKESRIVSVIGKILTPVLAAGIIVVVVAGVVNPIGPIGAPTSDHVAQDGILSGYQAMDIISIVGFAIVMRGRHPQPRLYGKTRPASHDGVLELRRRPHAGSSLRGAYLFGSHRGHLAGGGLNQAALIVAITYELMGNVGVVVLAVVVGFACFTTAVGLVGATAAYFERVTKGRISYRAGVIVTTLASLLICNLGLTNIVGLAGPILSVICPPFMVTVVLLLFRRRIPNTWVYRGAALVAASVSLFRSRSRLHGPVRARREPPAVRLRLRMACPRGGGRHRGRCGESAAPGGALRARPRRADRRGRKVWGGPTRVLHARTGTAAFDRARLMPQAG